MPSPFLDEELVERADYLIDHMPLCEVAELLPRSYSTLKRWKRKGYISTDIDWQRRRADKPKKSDPWRAVQLKRIGLSRKEVAERLGISKRSVSRYWNEYTNRQ